MSYFSGDFDVIITVRSLEPGQSGPDHEVCRHIDRKPFCWARHQALVLLAGRRHHPSLPEVLSIHPFVPAQVYTRGCGSLACRRLRGWLQRCKLAHYNYAVQPGSWLILEFAGKRLRIFQSPRSIIIQTKINIAA